MAKKTTDEHVDVVHRGQMAQALQGGLEVRLLDQEYDIVTKLVNGHKMGTLTDTDLRGAIGEIAGIRSVLDTLDADIRRGITELERSEEDGKKTGTG
tara:strand:+ start:352 stop:642 length:291 start_codon:yes stop_codon:yes gene_type:complete